VELFDAGNHRVFPVENNLVVVLVNDLRDQAIIDQDLGCRVRLALHPDLDPPPVPVKVGTFADIMEKAVTGIDMHLFIDPDFHCIL
jgi:hypothetical protein